jgi:tRNA uridine 5-carboxymethylaminomethyl modification enzyme
MHLKKYSRNKEKQKLNIISEGTETKEMYVDGPVTAISEEEQLKELREIDGMENIIMTRPGYGIKYNVLSPLQINKNLENIKFPGLFFCGRINGLVEYESTATQGYIAGINAFKKINK